MTAGRLSTCGICGGTIEQRPGSSPFAWSHVTPGFYGHRPEPDDSAVSGPESTCEWCTAVEDGPCDDGCICPECESERALDESYDTWLDRW